MVFLGGEEYLLLSCQTLVSPGDLHLLVFSCDLEGSCGRDVEEMLDLGDLDLVLFGDLEFDKLKLNLLVVGDLLFLPDTGDPLHILA